MNDHMTAYDKDFTLYSTSQIPIRDTSNPLASIPIGSEQLREPQASSLPMIIFLVSTLIALLFLVRLWKNRGPLFERLFWSVFLFVPVFGPLFFLVFYPSPTELEARRWASMNSVSHFGGGGRLGL